MVHPLRAWPVLATLAACSFCPPLAAQTGGTNQVTARDPSGVVFDTTVANAPAQGGTGGFGYGSIGHYALADAGALTWRALAGNRGTAFQDRVVAASEWEVAVLPGSSGLAMGTALTLTLQVRLDGSADAGLAGGNFFDGWRVESTTESYAWLAVGNPNAPDWDSETETPQFNFGGRGYALIQTGSCQQAGPCGGGTWAYTRRAGIVDVNANLPGSATWSWSGNSNTDTTVQFAAGPTAREGVAFDTGVLNFTLPVSVGDQLRIEGGVDLRFFCLGDAGLGTSDLPCTSHSDFSHSLQAALVSSVPGIEFAGLTPVPEPPAAALLLAGAVLLSLRRGTRAAA